MSVPGNISDGGSDGKDPAGAFRRFFLRNALPSCDGDTVVRSLTGRQSGRGLRPESFPRRQEGDSGTGPQRPWHCKGWPSGGHPPRLSQAGPRGEAGPAGETRRERLWRKG